MTRIIQNGNGNTIIFNNYQIIPNGTRYQKPKNKKRKNKKNKIDKILKYISFVFCFITAINEIITIIQSIPK